MKLNVNRGLNVIGLCIFFALSVKGAVDNYDEDYLSKQLPYDYNPSLNIFSWWSSKGNKNIKHSSKANINLARKKVPDPLSFENRNDYSKNFDTTDAKDNRLLSPTAESLDKSQTYQFSPGKVKIYTNNGILPLQQEVLPKYFKSDLYTIKPCEFVDKFKLNGHSSSLNKEIDQKSTAQSSQDLETTTFSSIKQFAFYPQKKMYNINNDSPRLKTNVTDTDKLKGTRVNSINLKEIMADQSLENYLRQSIYQNSNLPDSIGIKGNDGLHSDTYNSRPKFASGVNKQVPIYKAFSLIIPTQSTYTSTDKYAGIKKINFNQRQVTKSKMIRPHYSRNSYSNSSSIPGQTKVAEKITLTTQNYFNKYSTTDDPFGFLLPIPNDPQRETDTSAEGAQTITNNTLSENVKDMQENGNSGSNISDVSHLKSIFLMKSINDHREKRTADDSKTDKLNSVEMEFPSEETEIEQKNNSIVLDKLNILKENLLDLENDIISASTALKTNSKSIQGNIIYLEKPNSSSPDLDIAIKVLVRWKNNTFPTNKPNEELPLPLNHATTILPMVLDSYYDIEMPLSNPNGKTIKPCDNKRPTSKKKMTTCIYDPPCKCQNTKPPGNVKQSKKPTTIENCTPSTKQTTILNSMQEMPFKCTNPSTVKQCETTPTECLHALSSKQCETENFIFFTKPTCNSCLTKEELLKCTTKSCEKENDITTTTPTFRLCQTQEMPFNCINRNTVRPCEVNEGVATLNPKQVNWALTEPSVETNEDTVPDLFINRAPLNDYINIANIPNKEILIRLLKKLFRMNKVTNEYLVGNDIKRSYNTTALNAKPQSKRSCDFGRANFLFFTSKPDTQRLSEENEASRSGYASVDNVEEPIAQLLMPKPLESHKVSDLVSSHSFHRSKTLREDLTGEKELFYLASNNFSPPNNDDFASPSYRVSRENTNEDNGRYLDILDEINELLQNETYHSDQSPVIYTEEPERTVTRRKHRKHKMKRLHRRKKKRRKKINHSNHNFLNEENLENISNENSQNTCSTTEEIAITTEMYAENNKNANETKNCSTKRKAAKINHRRYRHRGLQCNHHHHRNLRRNQIQKMTTSTACSLPETITKLKSDVNINHEHSDVYNDNKTNDSTNASDKNTIIKQRVEKLFKINELKTSKLGRKIKQIFWKNNPLPVRVRID